MSFDPTAFVARVEWRPARTVTRFPHAYLVQPREDDAGRRRLATDDQGARFDGSNYA
jgi:hypothetical protein